jgi:hypothetical protein
MLMLPYVVLVVRVHPQRVTARRPRARAAVLLVHHHVELVAVEHVTVFGFRPGLL